MACMVNVHYDAVESNNGISVFNNRFSWNSLSFAAYTIGMS